MNFTTSVTEIALDTYRISTYHAGFGIQFNQFLVVDDEPFLMHTGFRRMFPETLAGVSQLIDPSRLRWIGYSHFEPDECGALNDWLATAPQAQAICSQVGAMVMLADFADRAPRALADGETIVDRSTPVEVHRDASPAARLGRGTVSSTRRPARSSARICSSSRPIRRRSANPAFSNPPARLSGPGRRVRWRTTFPTRRTPTRPCGASRSSSPRYSP